MNKCVLRRGNASWPELENQVVEQTQKQVKLQHYYKNHDQDICTEMGKAQSRTVNLFSRFIKKKSGNTTKIKITWKLVCDLDYK